MTITVFGATGRTGRLMATYALAAGHQVRALVRSPAQANLPAGVSILHGDVRDVAAVCDCVTGTQAVVSCLGAPLWQTFTPAGRVNSYGMPHIVAAMQQHGVRRIVAMSSYGAGDSLQRLGLIARVGMSTVMHGVLADMNALEARLRASNLAWTVVRPVNLTDRPRGGTLVVDRPGAISVKDIVTRADVVAFILASLGDPTTFKRALLLSELH